MRLCGWKVLGIPRDADGGAMLTSWVKAIWRTGMRTATCRTRKLLPVIAVGALCAISVAPVSGAGDDSFETPPALVGRVEFWKQIFAVYTQAELVIHDPTKLDRIYSVLDFSVQAEVLSPAALRRLMHKGEKREMARIRAVLRKLQDHPDAARLSVEEMRIRSLLLSDPHPDRFRRAADPARLRSQRGVRDRFLEGVRKSTRYLPRMEQIFRDEGVPVALTRLPLVESSFQTRAYSKVGAAGMWQFMPATGKRYLTIDEAVDERLDPFVASRAAARFLRANYEKLGTWPLAITAYNHGPAGMARAVRTVGTTDLGEIIRRYDSPTFGFASKNFYAEFLAALEVHRDYRQYFGDMPLDREMVADEVTLAHYVAMRSVAQCAGGHLTEVETLNPALRPAAIENRRWLPPGYHLRLPLGRAAAFRECYRGLPSSAKRSTHPIVVRTHRVRRGETLSRIARRYGVGMSTLRRTNHLRNTNLIRIGQKLEIPIGAGVARSASTRASRRARTSRKGATARRRTTAGTPAGGATHRVRSGETLAYIARRYGRSINSIRTANGLRDANQIRIGQKLRIPGGSSGANSADVRTVTHRVRRGQTLGQIARDYHRSTESIRRANGLRNANQIKAGQRLRIPGR